MIETDDDLVELLMIPSVGRVKARALFDAGYHTLQDIAAVTPEKLAEVPGVSIHMARSMLDFMNVMLGEDVKDEGATHSLFVCPMCGSMVSSSANVCPGCGVTFSDEEEEIEGPVESETAVEEGLKLFLCPECGSLISEGAEKCLHCGVVFDTEDEVEEMPLEMETKPQAEEDGFWYKERGGLYLCPACGNFITKDAEGCNKCGAVFDADDDDEEALRPQPRELECPMCKSTILADADNCDNCGFEFTDGKENEEDGFWYKVRAGLFMCPRCGSFITEGHDTCQNCGIVFATEEEDVPVYEESFCPLCQTVLRPGTDTCSECGFNFTDGSVKEPVKPEDEEEKTELFMCPNCGAFIASDAAKCSACGAVFDDEVEEEKPRDVPVPPLPDEGLEISDVADVTDVQEEESEEGVQKDEETPSDIPEKELKAIVSGDDLGLLICPQCGSLMSPGATRCNNCGADITGVEVRKTDVPSPEEDKDGFWYKEDDSLFMCPNCGAFIKSTATSCATCGVVFEGDDEDVEIPEPAKEPFACPNCGTVAEAGSDSCVSCGLAFETGDDKTDGFWYKDDTSLFVCPNCGSFISSSATSCNQCGIVFDGEEEEPEPFTPETPEEEDIEQSLYLCSECGAFLSASADKCPVCGTVIEDELGEESVEEEFDIPEVTEELSAEIVSEIEELEAETLEPPKKDIDELIKPKAKGISKDFLSRWQKKEEVSAAGDFKKRWESARTKEEELEKALEMEFLEVPEKSDEERLDEIDTALYSDPRNPALWEEKANILAEMGQQDDAIACYDKAAELDPDNEADYKKRILALLGVGLEEEMTDLSEFLAMEDEIAFDEALMTDKIEGEIADIDKRLSETPEDEALWQEKGELLEKLGRHEEAIECFDESIRLSYTDLQKESEGAVFSLTREQIQIGLTNGEGRVNGQINGLLSQRGMINGRGRTNGLINGGLINGLVNGRGRINGLVNGAGKTNGLINGMLTDRGRVNGLINGMGRTNGLINGQGRTNGLVNGGLINGLGLVNGEGLINGRGRFQASSHIERARKDWRYRVSWIVVLVALILVIPMFSNLQIQTQTQTIAIDGNFSDWEEVMAYSDSATDQIFNPDLNLLETKVVHEEGAINLMMNVEGVALGGTAPNGDPTVDSFFAFIDLDSDPLTGYSLTDLGADMMLEVFGWDNSVNSATSYRFNENENHDDWNGFTRSGTLPCALEGQYLETRMVFPTDLMTVGVTPRIRTYVVNSEGQFDIGDSIIGTQNAAVEVFARGSGPDTLAPGQSNVVLLKLSARSYGVNSVATWMNFTLNGGATVGDLGSPRIVLDEDGDGTFNIATDRTVSSGAVTIDATAFGLPLSEGVDIVTDQDTNLFLIGDITTGLMGRTIGLRMTALALEEGTANVVNEDSVIHNVGAPSGLEIDGAFGDWADISEYVDAANDVVPKKVNSTVINKNVDLADMRFGLDDELYIYTSVSGVMLGGADIPTLRSRPGPPPDPTKRDSDRDTVPDAFDGPGGDGSRQSDFDNDGTYDSNELGDVDGDGLIDYNRGGSDYWLNTTIPLDYPANYSGKNVSVYIGPIVSTRVPKLGEDSAFILIDSDDDPMSGVVYMGAIGADHAIAITGKHNSILSSELLRYDNTASPPWVPVATVETAIDWYRMELVVDPALMGIGSTDNFTVFVSMQDWKGDYDTGDTSVRSFDMDTTILTRGTRAPKPKIDITKTVDKATAAPGETLTYTILIENFKWDAYNVIVSETYPSGVTFVNANPLPTSGLNIWDIGYLAPNEVRVITITVTVDSDTVNGQILLNTASVAWDDGTGRPTVRSDTAETEVVIIPEMQHYLPVFIGLMAVTFTIMKKRKEKIK